ncbi:hypothetical protein MMC12_008289 [Toensbergia leucococca]|nr:hypothetical protein [Toensbergia leucococca]
MAETKRQNAGGKVPVATPNVGVPSMVSLETALSGAIGARIRLTTTIATRPALEGTLFTACPLTNLLALTTPTKTHILPISTIQTFTLLSLPAPSPTPFTNTPSTTVPLAPLSPTTLLSRADAAIVRLKEAESKKGKGVGREAQEIFDALSRTLPTRWDGTSIVVLDAVSIASPYRGEDCRAGQGQQGAVLGRVRKVLENERKRLADRTSKPIVPAIPAVPTMPSAGPRKGG